MFSAFEAVTAPPAQHDLGLRLGRAADRRHSGGAVRDRRGNIIVLDRGMARDPYSVRLQRQGPHLLSAADLQGHRRERRGCARKLGRSASRLPVVAIRRMSTGVPASTCCPAASRSSACSRCTTAYGRASGCCRRWTDAAPGPGGHALAGLRYADLFSSFRRASSGVDFDQRLVVVPAQLDIVAAFTAPGATATPTAATLRIPAERHDRPPRAAKSRHPARGARRRWTRSTSTVRARRRASMPRPARRSPRKFWAGFSAYNPTCCASARSTFGFESDARDYTYDVSGKRYGGPIEATSFYGIGGRRYRKTAKGMAEQQPSGSIRNAAQRRRYDRALRLRRRDQRLKNLGPLQGRAARRGSPFRVRRQRSAGGDLVHMISSALSASFGTPSSRSSGQSGGTRRRGAFETQLPMFMYHTRTPIMVIRSPSERATEQRAPSGLTKTPLVKTVLTHPD